MRAVQSEEVKVEPLSDVICKGTPNLETQEDSRADAQAAVVAAFIGTASGHRVERSTIVNRYLNSSEEGSGPTTSTWIWEKRR